MSRELDLCPNVFVSDIRLDARNPPSQLCTSSSRPGIHFLSSSQPPLDHPPSYQPLDRLLDDLLTLAGSVQSKETRSAHPSLVLLTILFLIDPPLHSRRCSKNCRCFVLNWPHCHPSITSAPARPTHYV
ncbi:hypothetical protein PGTUg99_028920 [Puccinia graminis f. sp. tritici]|uniref:Uncharacterized protein n=1 Tax=Puccinia graminis f. sp. tritici TaxID=56615 RepID=A0A5B0RHU3_PUCGR|nr:hypothetical protein PGTUg99_028920 [Puccinia graminis f. sp. tritici]